MTDFEKEFGISSLVGSFTAIFYIMRLVPSGQPKPKVAAP